MALKSVIATINGSQVELSYNTESGAWEATTAAPTKSSFNLEGGYYPVEIVATDAANNSTTANAQNNEACRLVVKEKVAPVIAITSPSVGAYLTSALATITANLTDNDSGVDTESVVVKIDDVAVEGVTFEAIEGGYALSATSGALGEGDHTLTIECADNDGNAAEVASAAFVVDTVAPELNVTAPVEGEITNNTEITVKGTTNDVTSGGIVVSITNNGIDTGIVALSGGAFSHKFTGVEGENVIVVTARDAAGKESTVTRTITIKTTAPVIESIELVPNPVDAGKTYIIKVVAREQ